MIENNSSMYFDDDIIDGINRTEREINESGRGIKVEAKICGEYPDMLEVLVNDKSEFNYAADSEVYAYVCGIEKGLGIS